METARNLSRVMAVQSPCLTAALSSISLDLLKQ
jgi:hypothetical protein